GKLDLVLTGEGVTKAILPGGLRATPEGTTLSMVSTEGFQNCNQVPYTAPADAAGCRRMLCSTAICPSIFSRPGCSDNSPKTYSCTMLLYTSGGQPLANTQVRVEFHVQAWTGGHCHNDGDRPVAYQGDSHGNFTPVTSEDETSDANGLIEFSFTAPEIAGGI